MDGEVEAKDLIDFPQSVMDESEAEIQSEDKLSSWREIHYDNLSYNSKSEWPEPKETKPIRDKAGGYKRLDSLDNNFRYQDLNLYDFSKHLTGLRWLFDEYLSKEIFLELSGLI